MKRYLAFLEQHSARFVRVLDDSIEMRRIAATLGQIEVEDSHQPMSASEISDNIRQAFQHGFRELSEAEFDEEQIKFRAIVEQKIIEPIDPKVRVVPWQELATEHRSYFHNDPAEFLSPSLQKFCVYDHPCHLTSDLALKFDSFAPTIQTSSRNLIFIQGLKIDGNLDAGYGTSELPLLVIVKGDLHVNNLILTGWAEIVVTGDVYVAGVLFGYDGEAGGRLQVQGNLNAQRVLGGMMYFIEVGGRVSAGVYWVDDDEPSLPNASIVPGSLTSDQAREFDNHTPLVREAYFVDSNWATGEEVQTYNFEPFQAKELIKQGKPLFR